MIHTPGVRTSCVWCVRARVSKSPNPSGSMGLGTPYNFKNYRSAATTDAAFDKRILKKPHCWLNICCIVMHFIFYREMCIRDRKYVIVALTQSHKYFGQDKCYNLRVFISINIICTLSVLLSEYSPLMQAANSVSDFPPLFVYIRIKLRTETVYTDIVSWKTVLSSHTFFIIKKALRRSFYVICTLRWIWFNIA